MSSYNEQIQKLKGEFEADCVKYTTFKKQLDSKIQERHLVAKDLNDEQDAVNEFMNKTNELIDASNTKSKEATAEYASAMDGLKTMTGKDLTALRDISDPSENLKSTMFALLWLIGKSNPTWESVQAEIINENFMHNVGSLNPQQAAPETMFQVKKYSKNIIVETIETLTGKIFAMYVLACEKYSDLELINAP